MKLLGGLAVSCRYVKKVAAEAHTITIEDGAVQDNVRTFWTKAF